MDNDYYVYIYWRLDTNEPFYVGKGRDDRWKILRRKYNKHFMNIINKHSVVVIIEKDNLTENEAFYWEEKIIEELVFEYGFSIDIPNNKSLDKHFHLVNQTWGGEGCSGKNSYANKTEEEMKIVKEKMRKAKIGLYNGKNNPNYGKSSFANKTEEEMNMLKERWRNASSGKNNPMYGTHRIGKESANKKSVICLTTKRIFYTAKDGAKYYKICISSVSACCRGEYKSAGKLSDGTKLVWKWLIWKHNKRYKINN